MELANPYAMNNIFLFKITKIEGKDLHAFSVYNEKHFSMQFT